MRPMYILLFTTYTSIPEYTYIGTLDIMYAMIFHGFYHNIYFAVLPTYWFVVLIIPSFYLVVNIHYLVTIT